VTPNVDVNQLLAKTYWRQEFNRRGYQGRTTMATERIAEALRAELRDILDNGGRPFDITAARHLYDVASAAKDLLTTLAKSVGEVQQVIADNGGAMESLAAPMSVDPDVTGIPGAALAATTQQAETFGARILREMLALAPKLLKNGGDDPQKLVAAIADAHDRGLHDVARELERRLVGTRFEVPTANTVDDIARVEVVRGSFEHGFYEGSQADNFDRGTVDGCTGIAAAARTPAYQAGWDAAIARRRALMPPPAKTRLDELVEKLDQLPDAVTGDGEISAETVAALCEGDS